MSKDDHKEKERQRVTKACDNCRKKKIKCDAKPDICTSCELLQIPCQYLDPTKKRGPPKGAGRYINAIEERLHRTEATVGGLSDDDLKEGSDNDKSGHTTGSGASAASSSKPRRRKPTKSKSKQIQSQVMDQESQSSSDPQQQQQQFPQTQPDHQQHPPSLQDYSVDHQLQPQQHQFQADGSFQSRPQQQPHQQQQFVQQQQLSLHRHPSQLIDSSKDSSQSPDRMSQTYSDDMRGVVETHMITPLHQDLLRENVFPSFNSPSPVLGSEHSHGDFNERSPGIDTLPRLGMNTPPMQELDDLEDDMGHLTLDHKGHERYVGKSSPMFYNRRHWGGYSIREREQPKARKFVENPDLPTPEVMTSLLNLHFTYVHPFAPVFVWSKFLKRLQTRDYSPSFLFLLNSIFALASRFSDDVSLRTDPTKPETVGLHFMEKAKAILDTIYDAPDMYCVGGLVLLSYQQMGTGGGYRAWMFIGISIRMAQHLGLNRDCMKLNPHMPALDREERNRIWWTCFVADRLVSASFGRPQGINEHDVDATYPEGIDEENIQLQYRLDNATSLLTGPSPHSEKNFVYLASLTRIMGRVMVSLYSPLSKATLPNSLMTSPAPLEQLDKELTDWLLTLPPHLQFRSVQQESGTFVCTLHMTFYATLILLHRPYSHQTPHNPKDWSISLSICTSAANNTIEMASNLMRTSDDHRDVPRLQCLLHSAVFIFFTAGIVHITNCTSTDPVLATSAKLRTVETLRCLSVIENVWMTGKFCGNNIKNLLKSRNIELPCSTEGFKYTLRNGADPTASLNGVNPAQLDIMNTEYKIPKEQSFAFDVDQIMGYYQPPGVKHAEPLGRNSRHFSPTPYFSPVSPHHSYNQVRTHPGLTQGHAPLPRRPRQTRNTSPSPTTAISPSSVAISSTGIYATAPTETVLGTDTSFYSTPLVDPFAAPGSATVVNGLQQTAPDGVASSYQNPFSSSVWNLPTSIDNEEWMLYMQNGGANSQPGVDNGPQQQQQQQQQRSQTGINSTNSHNNNNSHNNSSGNIKALPDRNSPTLLDNNTVNLNMNSANSASSAIGNRVHPLAHSLSRSDLMDTTDDGARGSITSSLQQQQQQQQLQPVPGAPNGTLMGGGYSSQGNSPTVQQQPPQSHQQLHQQQQRQQQQHQQQPLLPSQGPTEYTFYMNNHGASQPLLQQTVVSSQPWSA